MAGVRGAGGGAGSAGRTLVFNLQKDWDGKLVLSLYSCVHTFYYMFYLYEKYYRRTWAGDDSDEGTADAGAAREGALIVCPVVVAELRSAYEDDDVLKRVLFDLAIEVVELDVSDGLAAGAIQRRYRMGGGRRERIVADFLIGSHALHHTDRLIARDRGFYRQYFEGLVVWYPG